MKMNIKLDMFEGPLDLLLHLIDTSELDVCDIPISRITDQYMEYLEAMQEFRLEIASEFLVMAATLLSIKSQMLLPRPEPADVSEVLEDEEGFDPREELIQRLLEYKRYKRLADTLREREEQRSQVYTRMPMDFTPYVPEENPLEGITPDDLLQIFVDVMAEQEEEEESLTHMTREEVSVSDRMEEIHSFLLQKGQVHFSELLHWNRITRERVVTTFLALLELLKLRRIRIQQGELFEDIRVEAFSEEGGEETGQPTAEAGY
ncbi:segregation and condensation protein A [Melghirimyces algeriensis]|uniref:Segregation and condensation protein A n=1 Tax=Melghirimyces algeriensis TaxID=910412 RepID=A0A521B270_9BACL|nr:segregation/condensation protein A [Melghirimyces algeriensis]SMO41202.1 condensin subunit ScpA [Melghirimyces algeriensis]